MLVDSLDYDLQLNLLFNECSRADLNFKDIHVLKGKIRCLKRSVKNTVIAYREHLLSARDYPCTVGERCVWLPFAHFLDPTGLIAEITQKVTDLSDSLSECEN